MSARLDRAARMARSANRGNRVAAGFPIVDEATLRLRLHEYAEAEKRITEAERQLGLLYEHIVKRAFALADKGGLGILNALPADWLEGELMGREHEAAKGRVAGQVATIQAAGSAPFTHTLGGEE